MQNPEIPKEVEEWLKDIGAHKTAAEHVGTFYNTIRNLTGISEQGAVQLTTNWMMITYGFPKGMPLGGNPDAEA